ncbi:MAG: hypothetical protein NC328_08670 [Muribaculum sp.]|nr:hypothetical protein [Muribaculum sp.]
MKVFNILAAAALCLITASCNKASVTPQTTEIDGDLKGAFELVDEEYPIEKGDDGSYINVKVKRTDVSVPYVGDAVAVLGKSVDDDNIMVQAGFGYTLYDEAGKEIETVDAADNEEFKDEKAVLTLKEGTEGTLKIKVDAQAKPAKVKLTTKAKILSSGALWFVGSVGKYGVKNFEAHFNFTKGEEKGKYQYASSPAGAFLFFKGTNENYNVVDGTPQWKFNMNELNDNGGWSGTFEGTITLCREKPTAPYYYKMEGKFTNFRFDTYNFEISSKPIGSEND